jgi:hypothetical protein
MNFTKRSTAPSVPECHKVDPLSLDHVTGPVRGFHPNQYDQGVLLLSKHDDKVAASSEHSQAMQEVPAQSLNSRFLTVG